MSTTAREISPTASSTPAQRLVGRAIRWLDRLAPEAAAAAAAGVFDRPARQAPRPWERQVMDSATGRRLAFENGELQLYVWGEGPTVLLVHGWSGRPGQFAALIPALLARGYRVVSFDWPAHGRSSGRRTNAFQAARAIAAVVAAEGAPVAVVSHSLGGVAVSQSVADGLRLERLVMINTPTDPKGILAGFRALLGLPEHTVQRMQARFERRLGRRMGELDLLELAPSLPAATLLIHDQDDPQVPVAASRRLLGRRPELPLMTTRGLGHNRILAEPAVLERVLEHLEGGAEQETVRVSMSAG